MTPVGVKCESWQEKKDIKSGEQCRGCVPLKQSITVCRPPEIGPARDTFLSGFDPLVSPCDVTAVGTPMLEARAASG